MCWGVIPGSRPNGSACRRPSGPAGGPGRSLARRRGILRGAGLAGLRGRQCRSGGAGCAELRGAGLCRSAGRRLCWSVGLCRSGGTGLAGIKENPEPRWPGFFCRELRIKPVRPNPGRFRICACRASSARRGPGPGICGGRTLRAGLRRSCGWLRSWPDGRPSRC